ncbi:MAG TPA: hypothetical protein VLC91_17310 [Spongiibacteraceae bacterium]|nr:hypothetical protein [Spongiibacteraceae bacterium]
MKLTLPLYSVNSKADQSICSNAQLFALYFYRFSVRPPLQQQWCVDEVIGGGSFACAVDTGDTAPLQRVLNAGALFPLFI